MLTHDGFLVVAALHNLGGEASRQELMRVCIPQISGRFDVSLDNAISEGLIKQLYIAVATRHSKQSSTPKKSIYKLTDDKLNEQLDKAKLYKEYMAFIEAPNNRQLLRIRKWTIKLQIKRKPVLFNHKWCTGPSRHPGPK